MDETTMLYLIIALIVIFALLWRMIIVDERAREEGRLPPVCEEQPRKHLTKSK